MFRSKEIAILCAAAFILTLLIPWPWALIPAVPLCLLAPLFCMRGNRLPWKHRDWLCNPAFPDTAHLAGVSIDPELMIGEKRITAEAWIPFDYVTAERFRSKSGAMALSAAIALTDQCAADEEGVPFHGVHEIKAWESALGIIPENIRKTYPILDTAKFRGFRGTVVRDGQDVRAYFVGGPSIIQLCSRLLNGQESQMKNHERDRLLSLIPANALCYASAPIRDGKLDGLCYLGAVRPILQCMPSEEAQAAAERVHSMGFHVMLDAKSSWVLQTVRGMGIDWPEDDGSPDTVEMRQRNPEAEASRDFSEPLASLLRHGALERNRRILAMLPGALLWICATQCSMKWPLLIGMICYCAGILLCLNAVIPVKEQLCWKQLALTALPGILMPVVMSLYLPKLQSASAGPAGAVMLVTEAAVFSLWFPWLIRHSSSVAFVLPWLKAKTPGGWQAVILAFLICLLGFSLVLLIVRAQLITVMFGFIAGLLTGMSVLLVYHQMDLK